jgi:serine/threonine protein kinase
MRSERPEPFVLGELGNDRYVIGRRLGEGAFGVVYEAHDQQRDTVVALKVLRHSDATNLYRFKQEFRRLAQHSHQNLVTLYDLHGQDDRWFFTMELVGGVDFLSHVRGTAITDSQTDPELSTPETPVPQAGRSVFVTQATDSEQALALSDNNVSGGTSFVRKTFGSAGLSASQENRLRHALAQLTQGLEALHVEAMLHRDVKPSNVLVDEHGRVVLLDFGLVTDARDSVDARLVGTPAYMSPEQATGAAANEATDWYAVGVLLYETLVGRLPFEGNAREILAQKLLNVPEHPCTIHRDIPRDLADLAMRLLHVRPEERANGQDILRVLRKHSARPARASRHVYVGREREQGVLESAFARSRHKQLEVVILRGKSGTGKSMLVRRFLDKVREQNPSAVLLAGQCYEQETVPFEALDSVVDALAQYLTSLDRSSVETLLPTNVGALAAIFPVLRRVDAIALASDSTELALDPVELRASATQALAWILRNIAYNFALVVSIDNLHWGDADSTVVLDALLRATVLQSILFVATVRTEDGDPVGPARLFTAANAQRAGYALHDLEIESLSEQDAMAVALAQLGDASDEQRERARVIASESGGNPYFIDVLARHMTASPDDEGIKTRDQLDEVLWNSAQRLDSASLRLLECVAIAGSPLPFRALRRAASLGADASTSLARLRAKRFVRVRRSSTTELLECHHDRVRVAISSRLSAFDRQQRHRSLAHVLAEDTSTDPDVLAQHFEGAAEPERAAHYTILAADRAFGALAFDRAARLYLRAISLWAELSNERVMLLRERAGESLANAGRGKDAATQYLLAAQGAEELKALRLRLAAADPLLRSGYIDEGIEQLKLVLAALKIDYPATPQRALAALLWTRAKLTLRGDHYTPRAEATLSARELIVTDATRAAAQGLALVDNIRGAAFNAIHYLSALELGEPYRVARASAIEVGFYSTNGSSARRRTGASIERAMSRARACDNPHAVGITWMIRGISACMEGRFVDTVRDCDTAAEILRERCVSPWDLAQSEFYSLVGRSWLGEYAGLKQRAQAQIDHSEGRGDLFAATSLLTYIAFQPLLAAGQVGAAREMIDEAIGRWSRSGFYVQHWWALKAHASCDLYEGDGARALARLQSRWRELEQSLLLRVQYARVEALQLRARASVSAALEAKGTRREKLLSNALADAGVLQAEGASWSQGLGALIAASVYAQRGHADRTLEQLAMAERKCLSSDLRVHHAVAKYLRAKWVGGEAQQPVRLWASELATASGARSIDDLVTWLAGSRW